MAERLHSHGPEGQPIPELSAEQLLEIEEVVETNELILAEADLLLDETEQSRYPQPGEAFAMAPITPDHTHVEDDRMLWTEAEWPQVVGLLAERYQVTPYEIFAACQRFSGPEDETRVPIAVGELGTALGVFIHSEAAKPGEVPYVLFVSPSE